MMVLCNTNAIIEYDKKKSRLPSVPLDMEYDNNSIESSKHQSSTIQYFFLIDVTYYVPQGENSIQLTVLSCPGRAPAQVILKVSQIRTAAVCALRALQAVASHLPSGRHRAIHTISLL